KYYAVRHKSEKVRWASRSGGAFTALSDVVLQNGGVVYGCSLNENFEAVHTRAETVEERDKLRGSKYVQSNLSVTLSLILEDLQKNRVVMFVGTPCQVDAVKTMAKQKKLNSNLITVDFICHGVPSPKVFKEYISQFKNVTEFNFRDKNKFGWKAHKESIVSDGKKIFSDKYTKLYYQNYCVRPCCHECPYSQIERFSDITISDCWGIEKAAPKFNTDDSGVSMIIVNTSTGSECLKEAKEDMEICQINPNLIKQPVLESGGWGASNPNAKRKEFWKDFNEKGIAFVCEKYSVESSSAKIKKTLSSKSYKIRFKIKKMMGRN
ncbi:MAG: Coenzyme F420 hydrogenase/dehydrogenase, beta subunit C-terminal domain, partial [Ruminococcus sp.]|nr:Coenzyme F420 hydrogenase/dehydrogenase, beta subunit C-terminal domain [Candidatus Copronaster equi]